MKELKIEPKFRDLIPKLTDAEYAQLEKNILKDGRINEPIVTWNRIIIDGHHRYYIAQKHPEIPYEIKEKDFPNEYAAMAWACNNQLGRRNLSDKDRTYLIGKQYEAEKKSHAGAPKGNENARSTKQCSQAEDIVPTAKRTCQRLSTEYNMSTISVIRAGLYARGIDAADEIEPGIREEILHGNMNVPKVMIRDLSKAKPDMQKEVVKAISGENIPEAEKILESLPNSELKKCHYPEAKPEPKKHYDSNVNSETSTYNINDMTSGIRENWRQLESALNQMIVIMHPEVLEDESNKKIAISELENIIKGVQRFIAIIKQ